MKYALTTALLALAATQAHAALRSYEPFQAPAGDARDTGKADGLTDGFGWSGNYSVQDFNTTDYNQAGYRIQSSPAMSAGSLATAGNYLVGGNAYQSSGRKLDVGAGWDDSSGSYVEYRKDVPDQYGGETAYIGKENTTLWLSAIVRRDANDYVMVGGNKSDYPQDGDGQLFGIGYMGENVWGIELGNGTGTRSYARSTVASTQGVAALLVARIDFAATGDVVSLFVNPALGGAAPTTADASATVPTDLLFKTISVFGGNGNNQGAADEIRLGDTFTDVTPMVPEPAALAILSGFGLLTLRRRR